MEKSKPKDSFIREDIVKEALSEIYDPELQIDIWSLGLIYDINITDDNDINITMTLTFPGCPYGPSIVEEAKEKLKEIPGARNINIEITFEPPWSPEKIDPDVRAALNI